MISAEQLRVEELRLKYLELIDRPDVFPTRANWQFITSNSMRGLAKPLYRKYLTALTIDDNDREQLHDIAVEEFPKYIASIDRFEAIKALLSDITTVPENTATLIRDNNLFDADSLIDLIDRGDLHFALALLDVYQPDYSREDLAAMEELLDRIDSLPQTGSITRRGSFFGEKEMYICPDGHSNSADTEYCRHAGCGKNARGLTQQEENTIKLFSNRLSALRSLFAH